MRIILFLLFCGLCMSIVAQQDTIVVTDYSKVMVGTDAKGELFPITSLDGINQAGFFINGKPNGKIRICYSDELFIWINGRLVDVISDCDFYDPLELFKNASSDTLFISFSSRSSLADLKCELVVFEELLVIKDEVSIPRNARDEFMEFAIIALIILLLLLGIIVSAYPARISYLIERSFTLKASAYEFVNTGFFTGASMYVLILYALSLGFVGIYLDHLIQFGFFGSFLSLSEFLLNWLGIAAAIFSLFIAKWLVISIVSGLFHFRGLKNFQLFDFLNFNLFFLIPMMLFLVLDFIINDPSQSWITSGFMMLFPLILILFVLWFTFKFVNNSPRKKLIIISYLCATEIIPVIILLGWFYK